tara:strand:+ start:637 stop:804 length:168 start_codon:yes stop_codon:yes gene_type:complete
MKYYSEAALLYINRSKAGNAGKEMWVKFKDGGILKEFLENYKENWQHTKIDKLDM